MASILIVDDDPHIRKLLNVLLRDEGFTVFEATNGIEAISVFEDNKIDMLIIDLMMPKMDGFELCREIRNEYDLPIIMLTAKGETEQKVRGFKLGTDDYIVKPFEPVELVVRVKALLRRSKISSSKIVQIGSLVIDHGNYKVLNENEVINMPLKELELLFTLASSLGRTYSREQLIENIWGFDYAGDERTVDVHIKRLRERFPEKEFGFKISTVWGLGYRMELLK
ncbi:MULTISPECIES: response regulator transcription factor [Bacillaceae]|uniref:response regulator transcription factor n=1 Tax=Bacillaceae TaxID=186817 RepID=UPI000BEDDDC9|nr:MULTISPECIES: response regulator transcription factor [unclassified Bacillus (in: firmicutes)]PEC47409.1 DNA-binding response regulator [Bacillus sp. AFS096315]PFM75630.1 DNA-binding response regulator [Bacillus sp. AFS077874]